MTPAPVLFIPDVATMRRLADALVPHLQAGDLLVLAGDLGAGKTTFTQGLARALGIADPVTSPTFVIARAHPSAGGRPGLVHVDAYRIGSALELDDLDLDTELASSVAVVEWGEGRAEPLADERLVIRITRSDAADDETRQVALEPVGDRWARIVEDVAREFARSGGAS